MESPVKKQELQLIADESGIALYQRFSELDAAQFLSISPQSLDLIKGQGKISFIQLDADKIEFFGYQLLEYMIGAINHASTDQKQTAGVERIVRSKEITKITGLSRTTIWRIERANSFPARISLGVGSVGWRLSEVEAWMKSRDLADK